MGRSNSNSEHSMSGFGLGLEEPAINGDASSTVSIPGSVAESPSPAK